MFDGKNVHQEPKMLGRAATRELLIALSALQSQTWASVRAARAASQPALMAELEALAVQYDALLWRVQPTILFEPKQPVT